MSLFNLNSVVGAIYSFFLPKKSLHTGQQDLSPVSPCGNCLFFLETYFFSLVFLASKK